MSSRPVVPASTLTSPSPPELPQNHLRDSVSLLPVRQPSILFFSFYVNDRRPNLRTRLTSPVHHGPSSPLVKVVTTPCHHDGALDVATPGLPRFPQPRPRGSVSVKGEDVGSRRLLTLQVRRQRCGSPKGAERCTVSGRRVVSGVCVTLLGFTTDFVLRGGPVTARTRVDVPRLVSPRLLWLPS